MTQNASAGPGSSKSTYPLFNTTFTLHRLSPLYHGNAPSPLQNVPSLTQLARRFRDILKGEVLRGVHVGLIARDDGLGKAGQLLECRWTVLEDERAWVRGRDRPQPDQAQREDRETKPRGILIEIGYERASYTAILLRSVSPTTDKKGFTALPLLLTRMPNPLRERLIDYLSTTYDTRCSGLTLSSSLLASSLENYLQDLTDPPDTDRRIAAPLASPTMRDINLTLTFPAPVSPSLKTLDITIPGSDIAQFLKEGRRLLPARAPAPAPKKTRQTRASLEKEQQGPEPIFITALSAYTTTHLAMPLSTSTRTLSAPNVERDADSDSDPASIRISRIACGGFVLGAEAKVKIFAPPATSHGVAEDSESDSDDESGGSVHQRATQRFVEGLIKRAEGVAGGLVST
ncbi:MAG: hypothetical protein M4579_003452 [Chaenotheca gracillima]|nr:MAG: hypothetical protein M4579_003452 [Chaenotheca gracillima]